jgi:hypothetical protein
MMMSARYHRELLYSRASQHLITIGDGVAPNNATRLISDVGKYEAACFFFFLRMTTPQGLEQHSIISNGVKLPLLIQQPLCTGEACFQTAADLTVAML